MRLLIGAVGRMKNGAEKELFDRYAERVNAICANVGISGLTTQEISESKARTAGARRDQEARLLLQKIPDDSCVWALDEKGSTLSTEKFAKKLAGLRADNQGNLTFLLGGADGHGQEVKSAAHYTLSLSPMTLPHGLARIILAEQIYRALTIMSGHPYHRS